MKVSNEELIKGISPKINRKTRHRVAKETRNLGKAASYARVSSEMQNESSNDSQHHRNREEAKRNEHTVSPEHLYSDYAISGTKADRDGLNKLLKDAEEGKFSTIYFFSLSRLARESLIGMTILKRLVHRSGIRVISVSEGIDSDRDGWEMNAQVLFIVHEKFIEQLSEDVLRAQELNVLEGKSVGDHRFGYSSIPIPDAPPRGKGKKIPKQYCINEDEAEWVRKVFEWFVVEMLSIASIVKRLNEQNVPKGHRAKKEDWIRPNVISMLESTKYVGLWSWGLLQNHRDPETGDIWQEPRDKEDISDNWMRIRPDLQIVDVDLFTKAQNRLQKNRETYLPNRDEEGCFEGSRGSRGNPARHLLSNLLYCSCGHKMYISGDHLFCPNNDNGKCNCKSKIRKEFATNLIVELVFNTICGDSKWLSETHREVLSAWKKNMATIPRELTAAVSRLVRIDRNIGNLVDRIENGTCDLAVEQRLSDRQRERMELVSKIADLRQKKVDKVTAPTETWVRDRLQELLGSRDDLGPATIEAIHELFDRRIEVNEVQPEKGKHFRRGKITLKIGNATKLLLGESTYGIDCVAAESIVVTMDFKAPEAVNVLAERSESAKALFDQGMMHAQIAIQMEVSRSMVSKLLRFWFESRSLEYPDGRSRRSTLEKKHLSKPFYQKISDRVKEMLDDGLLLGEIGSALGCDRNTITSAARYWFESRGREYPDGRSRRKLLERKSSV